MTATRFFVVTMILATAASATDPQSYVGRAVCTSCHPKEAALWTGSHHDRALEAAETSSVLGNFNDARFTYNGMTSTFSRKGKTVMVRTDGPDGALHEYPIAYSIGIYPLQQYLVPLDGGRLQALSIAWDARPKRVGGQRWFHLYPNERVDFRDVLHWTGPAQNWNFMCADCHSTNVRKGYDASAQRFDTKWSAIDVSCEACHGPGAAHVAALQDGGAAQGQSSGLPARLAGSAASDWAFEGNDPIAHLARARDATVEVESCGRCHARRSQISDDARSGEPLTQRYVVSLLTDGLYEADGQIRDEVFEYGSFVQSRMFARGVVCSDCHEPHSGRLRAEGNALCANCHQQSVFDTPAHHHHKAGTAAERCVSCHMPQRTYMVVHDRHDHGLRVPRPDLTVSIGTPNVCTGCHADHDAAWAAAAINRWYGPVRTRGPSYAVGLAAGRARAAGADQQLRAIIEDSAMAGIVRATAVELLGRLLSPRLGPTVETALRDRDPLVRRAAVQLLPAWEPNQRWRLGAPLLQDPIRTVRIAAVDALVEASATISIDPSERAKFDAAAAEYRDVQKFNADRAEAWLNLGAFAARLEHLDEAIAAYQHALQLQPGFIPPYVNLADVYRLQGRDADGERVLQQALTHAPDNADVCQALGLLLVRQRRVDEAVSQLAKAAQLDADNPHYAYVYAVALDSIGQPTKAIDVLSAAQRRFTGDREILTALSDIAARAGDAEGAARWRALLAQLDGDAGSSELGGRSSR